MASTLVVCGGLPLIAWAMAAPGGDPIVAPFLSVCPAVAGHASHAILVSAASLDVPDSSDDEGDDDAPGGGVAVAADLHHLSAGVLRAEVIDVELDAWISRTPDGVSLRGPPSLSDDDDSLTDNDDDDDDDSDDSDQLKALRAAASTADASCRTESIASDVPARRTSSPTLGHSLRAPPERAL